MAASPPAYLHIQTDDDAPTRVLELGAGPVRVGRGIQCEVRLNHVGLGDVQCIIRRRDQEWQVQPVGPPGRIWVDNRPTDQQRSLPAEVPLRVGRATLVIHRTDPEQAGRGSFDTPITVNAVPVEPPPPAQTPIAPVPAAAASVEPEPGPQPTPDAPPEPASPQGATDIHAAASPADERVQRWQSRLDQRDQWLKDRQSEKRWEARWKAAGESIRARSAQPRPAAESTPPAAGQPGASRPDPKPGPGIAPPPAAPAVRPPDPVRSVPIRSFEPRPVFGTGRRAAGPDPKVNPEPAPGRPEPTTQPTPTPVELAPGLLPGGQAASAVGSPAAAESGPLVAGMPVVPAPPEPSAGKPASGDFDDVLSALRAFETVREPDSAIAAPAPVPSGAELRPAGTSQPSPHPRVEAPQAPQPPAAPTGLDVAAGRIQDPIAPAGEQLPDRGVPAAGAGLAGSQPAAGTATPGRPKGRIRLELVPNPGAREVAPADESSPHEATGGVISREVAAPPRDTIDPPTAKLAKPVEPPGRRHSEPASARRNPAEPLAPIAPPRDREPLGSRPAGGPGAPAAKDWPSTREIIAAQGRRTTGWNVAPSRQARSIEPTVAVRPDAWSIPFAFGWVPTVAIVVILGCFTIGLAAVWAIDSRSGNLAIKLATRPAGMRSPTIDPDSLPASTWWRTSASHLAAWAIVMERVGNGEDRTMDARSFEADARNVSPLGARSRFLLEPVLGAEADGMASIRLGPTRDVVTLTALGRRLRRDGKSSDALRAYRSAFLIAATTARSTLGRPFFRDEPAINRYALPHSTLLDGIARDMAGAGDWSSDDWDRVVPEFGPAQLAAASALRAKHPGEADRRLDWLCKPGERPLDPRFDAAEDRAAIAEGFAERKQWSDAVTEYRRAIDGETRDTDRRVWWFNLAELAGKTGDGQARLDAIENAKGTDMTDEVTQRAAAAHRYDAETSLSVRSR